MGRPTAYTPEIAAEICDRMAGGEPLTTICAGNALPDASTVRRRRYAHPEFRAMYALAREESGNAWAERALAMAMTANPVTAAAVRVKYDALRWYASKLTPKVYGDKLQHSGDADNPVATSLTIAFKRPGDSS